MKKLILVTFLSLVVMGCNNSSQKNNNEVISLAQSTERDDIEHNVVIDKHGDKMEISKNLTKDIIIIKLDGKSYELRKTKEGHDYSTHDNKYYYHETKKDITFGNKDIDMILFHSVNNKQANTMAVQ